MSTHTDSESSKTPQGQVRVRRLNGAGSRSTPASKKTKKNGPIARRATAVAPSGLGRREEIHIWDDPKRHLVVAAVTTEGGGRLLEVFTHDLQEESSERPPMRAGTIAACRVISSPDSMDGVFVDLGRGPNGYMRDVHIPPFVVRQGQRVAVDEATEIRPGDMFLGQVAGESRSSKGPRITGRVRAVTRTAEVSAGNPLKSSHGRVRMQPGGGPGGEEALPSGANRGNRLTTNLGKRMVGVVTGDLSDTGRVKDSLRAGAEHISELRNRMDSWSSSGIMEYPPATAATYFMRHWKRSIVRTVLYGKTCERWLSEELRKFPGISSAAAAKKAISGRVLVTGQGKIKSEVRNLERLVDSALDKTVPIKGGGSLVIEETEAFAAVVDVNGGRQVNEKGSAIDTNLAAAAALPAEIRARGLGGQVVVDFIDLDGSEPNARRLVDALLESISAAGLEAQVHRKAAIAMMGPLDQGIVLINVKRTGQPLSGRYWRRRNDSRKRGS